MKKEKSSFKLSEDFLTGAGGFDSRRDTAKPSF